MKLNDVSAERFGIQMLSDIVVYNKYARVSHINQRKETLDEIFDRLQNMHIKKYPYLELEIKNVFENYVKPKLVFPSMRSMQFGGRAIETNNTRMFNCSYLTVEGIKDIGDIMFLLMSGVGVGYGVYQDKLSEFTFARNVSKKKSEIFAIPDTAEGWSESFVKLLQGYFDPKAPKYFFKYIKIRPAGTPLLTSGGLAPGKEPLERAINKIRTLLDRRMKTAKQLTTLDIHDIICYMADAVISGGTRRSALIAIFDPNDELMFNSKDYKNYNYEGEGLNLQRARANNSMIINKNSDPNEIKNYINTVVDKAIASGYGEPGVFMSPNNDGSWGTNPCGEIGLNSHQFCNLTTINAEACTTQEQFLKVCEAASFLGTLQAGYTNFPYISKKWKKVTEREALLGVSMTGIASQFINNPDIDLAAGARKCVDTNRKIADKIGINKAFRITTVKPEGSSSKVIGTSSGIHAWHNEYYIQRITFSKIEPIYKYLEKKFAGKNIPILDKPILQQDATNPESAYFAIPIRVPEGSITRHEKVGDLLSRISRVYREWIISGTVNPDGNVEKTHNVSCTINFKSEEEAELREWLLKNYHNYNAFTISPALDPEVVKSFAVLMWEDISEEVYYKLVDVYMQANLDLTEIMEFTDLTNHATQSLACTAGGCEIL